MSFARPVQTLSVVVFGWAVLAHSTSERDWIGSASTGLALGKYVVLFLLMFR